MNEFMREGGFLGATFAQMAAQFRIPHRAFYDLAQDANHLAHSILTDLQKITGILSKSEQQRLALALLIRGVGLFPGVVLLLERGLVAEAGILTRGLIDTGFRLAVVVNSAEDAAQLVLNDQFGMKTAMERALTVSLSLPAAQRKMFEARIEGLKKALEGKKPRLNKIEDLAVRAGQSDIYDLFFRYYSGAVHSSPSDLKQHIEISLDRRMIRFRMGPRFELVPFHLSAVTFAYLRFLEVGSKFFGVKVEEGLKEFNRRLQGLKSKVRHLPSI